MADSSDSKVAGAPADGFSLSRWSRLKRGGADIQTTSPTVRTEAEVAHPTARRDVGGPGLASAPGGTPLAEEQSALPALSSISLSEDFTPFMQAKVPQALRQQALKALFKEPHFNVMDGLDTYIDDYTQFEPIAPEVMATLSSWKTIMNPPQQVVAPGGYAVDVESDEGKAVLAARSASLQDQLPQATDETALADTTAVLPATSKQEASPNAAHPRYGKRVGDFAATDANAPDAPDSESISSQDVTVSSETAPPLQKDA